MKRIVVFDTWPNDTNLGNKIISEAVYREMSDMFPADFHYTVPAFELIRYGRPLVKGADWAFVAGGNMLRSDMNARSSDWQVRLRDTTWMKGLVLLGVGWWQYQDFEPNLYTRTLLRRLLHGSINHSVRDSYTASKLRALGIHSINTGCPTLWSLTPEHCAAIPSAKSEEAVFTFTEYNQHPETDRQLFAALRKSYRRLYFWPQQFGDLQYARRLCDDGVAYLPPSLEAFDELLKTQTVDFVGTRLHAGIRALQHRRRTIIVAVDNRAAEMGRDVQLPMIARHDIALGLANRVDAAWPTRIQIDRVAIETWKAQFVATN